MDFLTSVRAGKYARSLWWRTARIRREKKRGEHAVLAAPARFIANFFAHRPARRRLISGTTEAISADSKPKPRAVRSRINPLDMTRSRDLSSADWITRASVCARVTCNGLVRNRLIACYTSITRLPVYELLSQMTKIYRLPINEKKRKKKISSKSMH